MTTVSGATGPRAPMQAQEDDRFGPYRILRLIGEGGMGLVYLAEQSRPIHREVALKVIKLGMDTHQVVARFDSERQALALMEHPNIAHVYDAGTSDRGRPYFAMEFVDGVPITQYCDEHLLNTRERLELFGSVCLALQHAHQKGVIHRDIKPSNALVTEQDGKPVPKVIDFGIAKATDQRLAERTAFTLSGNFVGTPEYMSPEQADLGSRDIDTTTDVYSLGVLLYELLVGAVPFDGGGLRQAGMAELLRIIREEEPPTPSVKLTRLGDTATELARLRHTDPVTLRRQLAGDLNWIVMKALEKDRRRRYPSVSEMAADIRRHLEDHPVLASPPGNLYRARKFVRRHKVSVSAGLVVAASLMAGIIAVGWEAHVAESRRQEAEMQRGRANDQAAQAVLERSRAEQKAREADDQRAQAEMHRLEADAQRREAEALFDGVRDLAKSMIFDVGDQISELEGATAAREILIRKALDYLDRLSKDPRATPGLRRELGEAYLRIGDLQGRPIHPNLGDGKAALESYKRSVALLESLAKANPKDPKLAHLLIHAYGRRGRLQERTVDAYADIWRAITMAEARVAAEPKSEEARFDLVLSLGMFGTGDALRPDIAEKIIYRRRALAQDLLNEGSKDPEVRRELAWSYANQGFREYNQDHRRAMESFTKALEQFESLSRDFPANAQYRRDEANTLNMMSSLLEAMSRKDEAIEYARRCVSIQQQLADGDAQNTMFRLELMRFQRSLAFRLSSTGKHQEAMNILGQALAAAERLVAAQPASAEVRDLRVTLNRSVASIASSAGDFKTALDYQRKAETELENLVHEHPESVDYASSLAQLCVEISRSLNGDGNKEKAIEYARRGVSIQQQVADGDAQVRWFRLNLMGFQRTLAFLLSSTGKHQEAMNILGQALAAAERLVAAQPASAEVRYQRATLNRSVASIASSAGDFKTALDYQRKAETELENLVHEQPERVDYASSLAQLRVEISRSLDGDGNQAGAQAK